MVATSQPLATRAGLRVLERGGNAADAALAAAAMLCVTEPMSTGIGGDAFAIVWRDGQLAGLDAAGPAPAAADPDEPVADRGPALRDRSRRRRRLGRAGRALRPARPRHLPRATRSTPPSAGTRSPTRPRLGRRVARPRLGRSARAAGLGPAAAATASGCRSSPPRSARSPTRGRRRSTAARSPSAIATPPGSSRRPRRVTAAVGRAAARRATAAYAVAELPPPTQGVAALEALGLLDGARADAVEPGALRRARARGRVRARARRRRRRGLLEPEYLDAPARGPPRRRREPPGGTVYLCAVDGDGMAVSFIQSLFQLRLGRRRSRAPGSCCRTAAPASPSRRASSRAPALPHDHPRDAAARRRARGPVRRHGRLHPGAGARAARARRSSTTGSTRRPRSTGRASASRTAWCASRRGCGIGPASSREPGSRCVTPTALRRRPGILREDGAGRRLRPAQGRLRRRHGSA